MRPVNESDFTIAGTLVGLLGGPGNVLTVTHTRGASCVKVAVADPAAARPAELRDHPAVREVGVSACGCAFDLDVGSLNSHFFVLPLLASASILPEIT